MLTTACGNTPPENESDEGKPPEADSTTYVGMESDFVSYIMPKDWGYDPESPEELNRHLGSHDSAPDVAAGEIVVFTDFDSPEDTELADGTRFLLDEFALADDATVTETGPVDIAGARNAERVDYEQEFQNAEFDQYHITDLVLRSPDGELAAVRVAGVTELVEDGTVDTILDSIEIPD